MILILLTVIITGIIWPEDAKSWLTTEAQKTGFPHLLTNEFP